MALFSSATAAEGALLPAKTSTDSRAARDFRNSDRSWRIATAFVPATAVRKPAFCTVSATVAPAMYFPRVSSSPLRTTSRSSVATALRGSIAGRNSRLPMMPLRDGCSPLAIAAPFTSVVDGNAG